MWLGSPVSFWRTLLVIRATHKNEFRQHQGSAVKNVFPHFSDTRQGTVFYVFLHAAWAGARWCAPRDVDWRALPGGVRTTTAAPRCTARHTASRRRRAACVRARRRSSTCAPHLLRCPSARPRIPTRTRRRSSSEHRRTTAMETSSSNHRAQNPNQSHQRMRLQTRPDMHSPRSGLTSHRQMNEALTTSRTAHTGHGAVLVLWGET